MRQQRLPVLLNDEQMNLLIRVLKEIEPTPASLEMLEILQEGILLKDLISKEEFD